MLLRARKFTYEFPRPTMVMGIVNVTPDSFSDGGQFASVEAAEEHALKLVAEGAEVLDIGGESSRPGAVPVSETEELRRVLPLLERLAARVKIPISIDTVKPGVARAALRAGASIVNDIAANRAEDAMWRVAAEFGAGYVCLHMQGTPQTMQSNPVYGDVVAEVRQYFEERIIRLNGCGVGSDQIILDAGIGFGKALGHNLRLLAALGEFAGLERPLLLGVSRKSFIGTVTGAERGLRLPGGLACAALAVEAGVAMIRTHDVAETVQAVRMAEAIGASRKTSKTE